MSAARVTLTRNGFVRYGSPSNFNTLGHVWRERDKWIAVSWRTNTERVFNLRKEAVSWIVKDGLW